MHCIQQKRHIFLLIPYLSQAFQCPHVPLSFTFHTLHQQAIANIHIPTPTILLFHVHTNKCRMTLCFTIVQSAFSWRRRTIRSGTVQCENLGFSKLFFGMSNPVNGVKKTGKREKQIKKFIFEVVFPNCCLLDA